MKRLTLLFAASTLLAATTFAQSNLIFEDSFEGPTIFSTVGKQTTTPYGLTQATDLKFKGSKSARFELRDGDPLNNSGTRAEVSFDDATNPHRWYSFAVYFPSNGYEYDADEEIITQFHQGGGQSPSISLETVADKLRLRVRPSTSEKYAYDLGPIVKNTWHQYVLHINHSNGKDGLIEIWRNGSLIFTRNGPNAYPMPKFHAPNWKLGLYKWEWNGTKTTGTKKRVIYFDDVKIGNEKATYADLAGAPTTTKPAEPVDTVKPPVKPVPAPAPTPAPAPAPVGNSVVFTLINSSTDKAVQVIANNSTIDLNKLGFKKVNIRAEYPASVGSVQFKLTGAQTKDISDNSAPFALHGDDGKGNYYFGNWNPPAKGSYTLTATPGDGSPASTIHFTITY